MDNSYNHKIVKFTGYIIINGTEDEDEILDALEAVSGRVDGLIKHPTIDCRETDWAYCDDNHPLNKMDAPVELCEKYFT